MENNRQPMIINLTDDNDISTIVLDDDEDDNDKTCILEIINDDSSVYINDSTLNETDTSPRNASTENDDCDVIFIDDDDEDSIVMPNQKQQSEKSNIGEKSFENEDIAELLNKKQSEKSNIGERSVENEDIVELFNKKQSEKSNVGEKSVENEDIVELTDKNQPGKSNIGENSVENEDIVELFNKRQSEKSNVGETSVENEDIVELFNKKQSEKSNLGEKSVENEDIAEVTNRKQEENSNICKTSVVNEDIVEVSNTKQQERLSISVKSIACISESSEIDKNCGELIDGRQCKRKRGVNCPNAETDVLGGKKVKVNNDSCEAVLSTNSDTNSVAYEVLNLSETCAAAADKSSCSVLNGRISEKGPRKRGKRRNRLRYKQQKLCKALKNSLLNDASNLENCFSFLHSVTGGLKMGGGGEGKKKKNEDKERGEEEKEEEKDEMKRIGDESDEKKSEGGCGGEGDNGENKSEVVKKKKKNIKEGEERMKNEEEKKNSVENKKKQSKADEKNESDVKSKKDYDDDVILVTSVSSLHPSSSFSSSFTSNSCRTEPANGCRNKEVDAAWTRPAHLAQIPNPMQCFIGQNIVKKLKKNKTLKQSATSSCRKRKKNYLVPMMNSATMSANSTQLSSNSAQSSNNAKLPANSAQLSVNSTQLSSGSARMSSKRNRSRKNVIPVLDLNFLTTPSNTKPTTQDSVIVIDDSAKVFKPRGDPVPSKSNQVSLVGNNIFIPSSMPMPAKTGLRPVFIDGCNVAFSHGRNAVFSVKGIEICVEYFRRLGNRAFVVLPNHRQGHLSDATLHAWQTDGTLVVTPSRRINHSLVAADDDRYVIQCAAAMDGIIVTSDQYRDHMGINPLWDETIKKRLLMLTWIQDILIFPDDPLGRHGPKLKDFLMY